jgi:hypothetical protein
VLTTGLTSVLSLRLVALRSPEDAGEMPASAAFLDAMGPLGERFGEDRLHELVSACDGGPGDLVRRVTDAVTHITGNLPQADDLTCLAVSPA